MHYHKQRVFLVLTERWWQRKKIVYAFASFACEPKMTKRLPVNSCHLLGIEAREWLAGLCLKVKPKNFRRVHRTLPSRD